MREEILINQNDGKKSRKCEQNVGANIEHKLYGRDKSKYIENNNGCKWTIITS